MLACAFDHSDPYASDPAAHQLSFGRGVLCAVSALHSLSGDFPMDLLAELHNGSVPCLAREPVPRGFTAMPYAESGYHESSVLDGPFHYRSRGVYFVTYSTFEGYLDAPQLPVEVLDAFLNASVAFRIVGWRVLRNGRPFVSGGNDLALDCH